MKRYFLFVSQHYEEEVCGDFVNDFDTIEEAMSLSEKLTGEDYSAQILDTVDRCYIKTWDNAGWLPIDETEIALKAKSL